MPDTNLWLWVLSLARVLNTHDKREGAGAASEMRSIHTQFTRRLTSPDGASKLTRSGDGNRRSHATCGNLRLSCRLNVTQICTRHP